MIEEPRNAATDARTADEDPTSFRDLSYEKQVERMRTMYADVRVRTS